MREFDIAGRQLTKFPKSDQHAKAYSGDLFSGCGGLTLGLKQAGFRVIGAFENNEWKRFQQS
jgi:hypothetical protein